MPKKIEKERDILRIKDMSLIVTNDFNAAIEKCYEFCESNQYNQISWDHMKLVIYRYCTYGLFFHFLFF